MTKTPACSLLCLLCIAALSCDQSNAHFPDAEDVSGACGPWYPGGESVDAGTPHAIEEGAVFPCLLWESVRQHKADTWLNVGEVYLSAKHDQIPARALIIAKVGVSCAACQQLVMALAAAHDQLDPIAVMLALTHGNEVFPDIYPLSTAEAIIVDHEGWPESWYLTNDVEDHFSESQFVGIPWVTVVDLTDMTVVSSSNSTFFADNVDELVALVQSLQED